MPNWHSVLRAIAPKGRRDILDGVADAMPAIVDRIGLTTIDRQAIFLGEWAEETDGFRVVEEYASGAAYEGRRDLGNVKRGDGRRYKGRGVPMLTGRANYRKYGPEVDQPLEDEPEKAKTFPTAIDLAAAYWDDHNLNALADRCDEKGVTRKINGGLNGFPVRKLYIARARKALGGSRGLVDVVEPFNPDDWPREKVAALQTRLAVLGYTPGEPDGRIGTGTVSALSAFQHDNDIDVCGLPTPETDTTVWSASESRPVPTARANGKPKDSETLKGSTHAGVAAATGTAAVAVEAVPKGAGEAISGALDKAEQYHSYWERFTTVAGDAASGLTTWATSHPLHVVALVALAYAAYRAFGARAAEIIKYRTWGAA